MATIIDNSNQECDTCGAIAVTEYIGGEGSVYPLCGACDVHLRETLAGAQDEEEFHGPCEDCHAQPATTAFLHLDGRRFQLCGSCFAWADHEEDYLMFCECAVPRYGEDETRCAHCHYEIHSPEDAHDEDREDWVEEQDDDFLAEEEDSEDDDDEESYYLDDPYEDSD